MSDLPLDMDASGWITLGVAAVALVILGVVAGRLKNRRGKTSSRMAKPTDAEIARQRAIDEAERLTRNPRERF